MMMIGILTPLLVIGFIVMSIMEEKKRNKREQENKGENNISNENKNEKEDSNNGK
ncbi:membrane protein [Staphylococcus nepalensis]|mgnify:FL=1|nr:membrane protein [Staphylococcus nepalensis]SUM66553.1 membrane protein [Staphylococcus nepalensis]SUM94490.1 membrane protein [Staphylococcus nepalensis]VDG65896.1 Uncharacterised protein [Lacrimispora indolis]